MTAIFSLILIASSIVSSFGVSRFLSHIPYKTKIVGSTILRTLGFLCYYFAFSIDNKDIGFYMCLGSTVLLGSLSSIEKVIYLGYLKDFPKYCFSFYFSGLGFCGLISSIVYLVIKKLGIDFKYVCLAFIPLNFLILILFVWLEIKKSDKERKKEKSEVQGWALGR